jgi:hypothetical protein
VESLGRVATVNFKGVASTWWNGLTQEARDHYTLEWPRLCDFVCDSLMSKKWIESEWLRFQEMRYRQRGHEKETPTEYISRKLILRRKLHPVHPEAEAAIFSFEVANLWLHSPSAWSAHVDIEKCPTAADLIKLVTDKDEQLQASSNISRMAGLMCNGFHFQGNKPGLGAHVADAEQEEELFGLTAEPKNGAGKDNLKAPGKFPFPLANNSSRRMPPRPCRNCGSPLHYDRDCASWRNRGRCGRDNWLGFERKKYCVYNGNMNKYTCSIYCSQSS